MRGEYRQQYEIDIVIDMYHQTDDTNAPTVDAQNFIAFKRFHVTSYCIRWTVQEILKSLSMPYELAVMGGVLQNGSSTALADDEKFDQYRSITYTTSSQSTRYIITVLDTSRVMVGAS